MASPYAVSLCHRVVHTYGCATVRRAVVVGLGVGYISGCLRHHCPDIDLLTVDIDQHVLSTARTYFGWNQSTDAVSLVGAAAWFKLAVTRKDSRDLVVLDCAWKHSVPPACRSPLLMANMGRVLGRSDGGSVHFAANLGFSKQSKNTIPAFKAAFAHLHLRLSQKGQWLFMDSAAGEAA